MRRRTLIPVRRRRGSPARPALSPPAAPWRRQLRQRQLAPSSPAATWRWPGPYAQIGETDNWGAQAYFKHVNATGGILGHKVNYITLNNQSNAAQSELIARKCIQTYHAQFIIGPESGADTESALPIAIANHTILISLSSGWQTNGYPTSELNSWGFPGFYDVFAEDQYRLGAEPHRAAALHQGRAARGQLRLGLPGQPGQRAGARQAVRLPARLHPDRPGGRHRRHPAGARHAGDPSADHLVRPGAWHRLDHRDPGDPGARPDHPDQRVLRAASCPASSPPRAARRS